MKRNWSLVAAAILIGCGARSLAWDHAGHMLVNQIAWSDLKPATRDRVSELAKLLPTQHNLSQPYNFVTAGCWMDDMRSEPGYAWGKLHYVNIPWTPDASAFAIPEPPHVVSAIEEMREKFRTRAAAALTPARQAEALAMLVHFVGDLHQPMHATDRGDRGGNGFMLSGVVMSTLAPKRPCTLHFLWDAAFRLGDQDGKGVEIWLQPDVPDRPKAPGEGVIATEAAKLVEHYPKDQLPELNQPLTAVQWARESHEIGCKTGYPEGLAPSDTEIHPVPTSYVAKSAETARRRVTLAGYRLAAVLEELFGGE